MKKTISINALFLTILITTNSSCALSSNKASNSNAVINANTTSNVSVDPTGTATSAGAESPDLTAAALVAELYKQHDAKKSPFFQSKNRSLVDKYFTKTLADLIWTDATDSEDEVGAIDGDPLYDAQDTDIKNFAIGKAVVKGETATVPVTFTNFGKKKTINFSLKQVKGSWKIDNIIYGGGQSLLKWLKETYAKDTTQQTPTGEFEGKYQVGDTTCTVKPVKMAFEVRWAKGSGVEMFFSKGGNTFESSDKGGSNRFEFDDENYTTGTFYRADGKTLPINRAK